jgi:outer membrane receptor protein involved in Fe transport
LTGQIYNPFAPIAGTANRAAFIGNIIPLEYLDPVALQIVKYYPEPNVVTTNNTNNYYNAAAIRVTQNAYSGRIDQNVTSSYRIFGRYSIATTGLTQPNQYGNLADAAGSVGTTYFRNQSFSFGNVISLNAKSILTIAYGYARWHQIRRTLSYGFSDGSIGWPSQFVSGISISMFPAVQITGYGSFGGQWYFNNGNDSHALLIGYTRSTGRNTFKAGVDGRMHIINFFNSANPAGLFAFTQQFTRQNNATTAAGNAFASFLLGAGSSGSITNAYGSGLRHFYGAAYLQDDYRLTPRLTLNLGVRYDGESPYLDKHNYLNHFDPNIASPARNSSFPGLNGGPVFANANGLGRSVYTRDHLNIAPRVGFAFAATPTTSFRAGYGISYAPLELTNMASERCQTRATPL